MSELIIESHKNATIIVLRSGCEQQRHTYTYLDKTWQPQHHVTSRQLEHGLAQLFLIYGSGTGMITCRVL